MISNWKRDFYLPPNVKVVAFVTESGFTASDPTMTEHLGWGSQYNAESFDDAAGGEFERIGNGSSYSSSDFSGDVSDGAY